jgi:hypothetical protein
MPEKFKLGHYQRPLCKSCIPRILLHTKKRAAPVERARKLWTRPRLDWLFGRSCRVRTVRSKGATAGSAVRPREIRSTTSGGSACYK